jgi:hypothetical protein
MTQALLLRSKTSTADAFAERRGTVRHAEMSKLITDTRRSIARSTEQLDEIKRVLANSEHAAREHFAAELFEDAFF